MDRIKTIFLALISIGAVVLFSLCMAPLTSYAKKKGVENSTTSDASAKEDLGEISRQLENPLTSLWSLTFEDSVLLKEGDAISGTELANTLFFQPGLPIPVGEKKDKVFIARPVFPLVTNPVLDPTATDDVDGHETGFGDIQFLTLLGPNRTSGIVWGAGATFKFPTATDDVLGEGKYQAGPAAMFFRLAKPWTVGFLYQHWWSYAGDNDRSDTNQTDLKYIIRYSLPDAWSIGMGPTVTVDWEADSENRWTVPIGLGVTKMVRFGKMPVKFIVEVQYSVIRPEDYGTQWKFLFRFAPVIPSPFR